MERKVAQHRGDPLTDAEKKDAMAKGSSGASIFEGWRELVPAVKFEVRRGMVSFGNRLVPYSFVTRMEHFSGVYFTSPASNPADLFM